METLIILWENQPVQHNVSNHSNMWNRPEEIKIIDEIKERGIFSSPRFDDVFRKINALHTYFVA